MVEKPRFLFIQFQPVHLFRLDDGNVLHPKTHLPQRTKFSWCPPLPAREILIHHWCGHLFCPNFTDKERENHTDDRESTMSCTEQRLDEKFHVTVPQHKNKIELCQSFFMFLVYLYLYIFSMFNADLKYFQCFLFYFFGFSFQWRIQDFPDMRRSSYARDLGENILFDQIFGENCMKLKQVGLGKGTRL